MKTHGEEGHLTEFIPVGDSDFFFHKVSSYFTGKKKTGKTNSPLKELKKFLVYWNAVKFEFNCGTKSKLSPWKRPKVGFVFF